MELTLLERFSKPRGQYGSYWFNAHEIDEIRRALAIAQAVEEMTVYVGDVKVMIMRRADELLEGKK